MPKRKWLPAVAIIIAGLAASSLASARTDTKCLAKPGARTPQGQHWYYWLDHVHKRKCWYLREEGLPVREHAPQAETQSAPQASAQPVPAPEPRPTPEVANAAPPAPPPNDFPATAAPVPWLDVMHVSKPTAAAPAPAAAAPAAAPAARVSNDPPPAPERVADGANKLPPPADKAVAAPARAAAAPAPARDPVRPPHKAAASPLAPVKAALSSSPAFALFMLLFAGLAVAGPIFHVVQRRRRAFEAAAFQPPRWAPVVALNAPSPRVHVPPPAAPPPARAEPPPARPAAPPLVPAEHTERLAQALQQLADRLRAQEPAPSIVPQATRRAAPRPDEAPEHLRLRRGAG